mmetsp:Transcript_17383/g.47160  ORF Transcript_17383/g.47160 Transcript_17383/m.47160 type:complete len:319 (-) Transcript_17383:117-1073(-)
MLHFVVLCSALVIGASSLRVTEEPAVSDFFEEEVAAMKSHFHRPGAESARLIHVAQNQDSLKPLMFIHVHKSLGSWMCWVVQFVGGSSIDHQDCSAPDDTCWASSAFDYKSTCAARVQQLNAHNWTFYEIERWIDFAEDAGDWCPEELSYAIIMRDPVKRAASQMTANKQTIDDIKGWFESPRVFNRREGFVSSHVSYDNFYVRTLCGVECFFLPPGAITEAHLEKAKKRLEELDAVLMVEDLLTQLVQLEALTGWKGLQSYSDQFIHNDGCIYGGSECAKFLMTGEAEAFLRSHNQLDVELYQYATGVASRKTDALF